MTIRITQTRYEPVPTGEYQAVVADITEETGLYGPQLKFVFSIVAPEHYNGRTLLGWCTAKFSPKSKLYAWTRAALGGRDISPDMDFDSDQVINQPVVLAVVVKEGDKGPVNQIFDVKPMCAGTAPAAQPTPQADGLFGENAAAEAEAKAEQALPF